MVYLLFAIALVGASFLLGLKAGRAEREERRAARAIRMADGPGLDVETAEIAIDQLREQIRAESKRDPDFAHTITRIGRSDLL